MPPGRPGRSGGSFVRFRGGASAARLLGARLLVAFVVFVDFAAALAGVLDVGGIDDRFEGRSEARGGAALARFFRSLIEPSSRGPAVASGGL
jgi:hypothetical protein